MPTVSVLIPNYNHAPFLEQRIDSVLEQTHRDFELIILDDGSTDGSRAIIEHYRKNEKVSHIVYNEKNSGSPFRQWEKGLRLAKGKFIWIAESDDVAEKVFLEKMISSLKKNDNCILATSRTAHIDATGRIIGINLWPDELDSKRWCTDFVSDGADEIAYFLRFRDTIPNASAVVFRNDVKAELQQLVQENWQYNGDWFFWTALLKKGRMIYHSEILNYQRFHTQTTRSIKMFAGEEKRFRETVTLITELNRFVKQKINWFDQRYNWVFDQLTTRIRIKDKLNPRYYRINHSLDFGVRLFRENTRYYMMLAYKKARFKSGALRQKLFYFLGNLIK